MKDVRRIPKLFYPFVSYMKVTDELQLTLQSGPGTERYKLFGWTDDESEDWTSFRKEADELFMSYSDPDKVNSIVRKKLRNLIQKVKQYDHDSLAGHHLMDKVALNGTIDDCFTFNVKRATSLAKTPVRGENDPGIRTPRISLRKTLKRVHVLDIDDPLTPDSKAKPKGILAILVFCYIGKEKPESYKGYELVGVAIRGRFINRIKEEDVAGPEKVYCYYYALYISTTGKIGSPGNIIAELAF